MASQLLVLDEVLAMLEVVGVSSTVREKFRTQAISVLQHKARRAAPDDLTDHVSVSSGFGTKSQQGFVELTVNDVLTQMDVAKAREIGLMLIQSSEAAIADEVFVTLMRTRVGITDGERLGQMLLDLREIRQGTRGMSRTS